MTETPVLNNIWNANCMFMNCKKLIKSNVNHSSITTCANMYAGCISLEKVEGDFDNINSASSLFADCENLKEIPTNFPKLRTGIEMFKGCYKLSAKQLAEVLISISDVTDITAGPTGITFPLKCAESDDTKTYLETNYPGAIAAAAAKNWLINYR